MNIRVHYRDEASGPWMTRILETGQVPISGEFLAPAPVKVYRVVFTLHILFDADYDAEVFAEQIDFEQTQLETLGAVVWRG